MNTLCSSLRGFTFNNIHNSTMGVVMHSTSIQQPPKKKTKDTVPFMNGSYDFSTVGSNGEITYEEREIKIVLGLPADNKEALQVLYSSTLEWLVDSGKQQLIFDSIRDYYYIAEVESASSFEETMSFGQLTLTFVASPFKSSIEYVGSDVWDNFNFEEDQIQDNTYTFSGSTNIVLFNPTRPIKPIINCTSAMTMIKDGITYNLTSGVNSIYGFKLSKGSNTMTVSGNGTIQILFRKERL